MAVFVLGKCLYQSQWPEVEYSFLTKSLLHLLIRQFKTVAHCLTLSMVKLDSLGQH